MEDATDRFWVRACCDGVISRRQDWLTALREKISAMVHVRMMHLEGRDGEKGPRPPFIIVVVTAANDDDQEKIGGV